MIEQKLTQADLDAIARKHNPRKHICSDTAQMVTDRRLREQAAEILRKQAQRPPVLNEANHMKKMTAIRSSRREQMIDAVAEYICGRDRANRVSIAELSEVFGLAESTINAYVRYLVDDERIHGEHADAWPNQWLLWGKSSAQSE